MSLVGQNMYHNTWGIGIVECEDNNILYVRFLNTADGEILKRFVFPDAIIKGHLVGADEAAQIAIATTENEKKCNRCGKGNVRTSSVDGERMCAACCSQYAAVCCICGKIHISNKVHSAYESIGSFKRKNVCENCVDEYSFQCERCSGRYLSQNRAKEIFIQRSLCRSCAEDAIGKCGICGKRFDIDNGASVYENGKIVQLCDSCAEEKTFRCTECGYREPLSALVDSRYIPATERICRGCAHTCAACNEYFHINHDMYAFNEYFCPDCWESKILDCTICGDKFYPRNEDDKLCPDCVEMRAYNERLKSLPYLQAVFREEKYYMLEYLDRCKLFTELYRNCRMNIATQFTKDDSEPYYYLILGFAGYRIVVSYVPDKIKGLVRFSKNVTMTEFRSKKGARSVRFAIEKWLRKSTEYMDTSAGKMKILSYPVLLRVQTDFDKNYGKQWNGPDDYIEIGNYGDTTEFYIVGVLDEERKKVIEISPR